MAYINVGAYVNRERPRTKKALREALATDRDSVQFDRTSTFEDHGYDPHIHPDDIRAGDTLTVTGPDPYRSRKWYASVTRDFDGKIRIK